MYESWIVKQPELMYSLHELHDKRLGCWCKPKKCHSDILLKLVNIQRNEQQLFGE